MNRRAGELTEEEVDRIVTIMQNPRQYKIPDWFLNRQKDIKDGKFSQVSAPAGQLRKWMLHLQGGALGLLIANIRSGPSGMYVCC